MGPSHRNFGPGETGAAGGAFPPPPHPASEAEIARALFDFGEVIARHLAHLLLGDVFKLLPDHLFAHGPGFGAGVVLQEFLEVMMALGWQQF